jgi:hypothetical protein
MPGSLGRFSEPDDTTTWRARKVSPRLVVSTHWPALVIPALLADLGLEVGAGIKIEVLADALRVLEDLGLEGILLRRHVAGFFQQRQVDIGLDVALRARVAIPVPGATVVAGALDDAEVVDAFVNHARGHAHAAKAAAQDHDLDGLGDRLAHDGLGDVRVFLVVLEIAVDIHVLMGAVLADAAVALGVVLLAQLRRVEAEHVGARNAELAVFDERYGFVHVNPLLGRVSRARWAISWVAII